VLKQHKFNYTPVVINSVLIELIKPISHIQKTKESTALVLYKYNGQSENVAQIKLVSEVLPYEEIEVIQPHILLRLPCYDVCPNNYHQLIGKKLKDFVTKNLPDGDEEIQDNKESKENDKNNIASYFLTDNSISINFHSNEDNDSYGDGGGDGAPP